MKKIIICLMCLLPIGAFAQNKFGHINTQELISIMPERAAIEGELETLAKEYETEMLKMREEYYAKIKEFQEKEATMPASIKETRQAELMEMEQRIQTFQQTASADIQKRQETLFGPVITKIKDAINAVGVEGGFTYIFDVATQAVLYTASDAHDVMPLVKAKLGIK